MIVGITGGYCAGKNFLCDKLTQFNFDIIDVDFVGHLALKENKERLFSHFGNAIQSEDNNINRKKLGEIVFANKKQLKILETIVHPWMKTYISNYIAQNKHRHIIINAALLFYLNLDSYCDHIIIISISCIVRFYRALKRDSLGIIKTFRRFISQQKIFINKNINNTPNYTEIEIIRNNKDIQLCIEKIGSKLHGKSQQSTR